MLYEVITEFYGSVQNERPLQEGREYQLWLDASALVAEGVRPIMSYNFV